MPLPTTTKLRLDTQLDSLFLMIGKCNPAALQKTWVEGKWSMLEHMAHLARYQEIFIQRLDRIQQEDLPAITAYRAERDPAWLIWKQADLPTVTAHLKDLRTELVTLLNSYSPQALKRLGYHANFEAMDVPTWTEFFLLHEAHHLYALLQMRQKYL